MTALCCFSRHGTIADVSTPLRCAQHDKRWHWRWQSHICAGRELKHTAHAGEQARRLAGRAD